MMLKRPFLSVIIPCFNEEKRIHNIKHIYKYLNKSKINYEIIIINDGSIDNTISLLNEYKYKIPFKLVRYKKNRGKGYAIKKGMLTAKGMYRLFVDIDLSTPMKEFDKFIPHLKKVDIIIATRKKKNSVLIKRQPFLRELMGKGFTFLSQIVLRTNVSDFTCGFKCFSANAAKNIFSKQKIDRWGFDSEILFIATKYKYKMKEIKVRWKHDPRTKVRFPHDIITTFFDLGRIIYYDLKNIYN